MLDEFNFASTNTTVYSIKEIEQYYKDKVKRKVQSMSSNPLVQCLLILSQDKTEHCGNGDYFQWDTSLLYSIINSISTRFQLDYHFNNNYWEHNEIPARHPTDIENFVDQLNELRPELRRYGIDVQMSDIEPPTTKSIHIVNDDPLIKRKRLSNSQIKIKKC
jgi:hypothetical protein